MVSGVNIMHGADTRRSHSRKNITPSGGGDRTRTSEERHVRIISSYLEKVSSLLVRALYQ